MHLSGNQQRKKEKQRNQRKQEEKQRKPVAKNINSENQERNEEIQ